MPQPHSGWPGWGLGEPPEQTGIDASKTTRSGTSPSRLPQPPAIDDFNVLIPFSEPEFTQLTPSGMLEAAWKGRLRGWADQLTECCRAVDARSTDETLAEVSE